MIQLGKMFAKVKHRSNSAENVTVKNTEELRTVPSFLRSRKFSILLIMLGIGAGLLLYSIYVSYPVSIDSQYDFIYNHMSPFYWVSLPMILGTLFFIGISSEKRLLSWLATVTTFFVMISDSFFFRYIPGSDSLMFRGLTENLISTGDLSLTPFHSYYKWPVYFVLNKVSVSVMALDLRIVEFVLYCAMGIVFASSVYLFTSRVGGNGYLMSVFFFILQRYFLNYQWVPFSLAFSFLLLLFAFDDHFLQKPTFDWIQLFVFFVMTFMHAFVAVFFIIYESLVYLLNRRRRNLILLFLMCLIYSVSLVYYQPVGFVRLANELTMLFPRDYAKSVAATLSSSIAPTPYIASISQTLSRVVVITSAMLIFFSFLIFLVRRSAAKDDMTRIFACLFSGILYVLIGFFLPLLGTRALPVLILPLSIGVSYLGRSRFRKYFELVFLVMLLLFPFITIHLSFFDQEVQFQTEREYVLTRFMTKEYDWNRSSLLLSHFRVRNYLEARSSGSTVVFEDDLHSANFLNTIVMYDCVVYTVGVGKSSLGLGYSSEESFALFEEKTFNQIYDSGNLSHIFVKSG